MSDLHEVGHGMKHELHVADARAMSFIPDGSAHLVVTSPPYWNLKDYSGPSDVQLGSEDDYDIFVDSLTQVWSECFRILVPGGRLVCVVGDVCMSKRKFGRHLLMPLHADVARRCVDLGFDYLNPIIWHKITNVDYKDDTGHDNYLGSPYLPNGIIKNEVEYILMLRKPGGYRKLTPSQKESSLIPKDEYHEMFAQVWTIRGTSTKRGHPAPFPLSLADRLVRMFSYVGDVVIDPFVGSGTTCVAAANRRRSSVGVDVSEEYIEMSSNNMRKVGHDVIGDLFSLQGQVAEVLVSGGGFSGNDQENRLVRLA